MFPVARVSGYPARKNKNKTGNKVERENVFVRKGGGAKPRTPGSARGGGRGIRDK